MIVGNMVAHTLWSEHDIESNGKGDILQRQRHPCRPFCRKSPFINRDVDSCSLAEIADNILKMSILEF